MNSAKKTKNTFTKFIASEALSYEDVNIVPQYSEVRSRSELSTKIKFGTIDLEIPVVSANMDTVTDIIVAKHMKTNGGLGILPRQKTMDDTLSVIEKLMELGYAEHLISFSIGAKFTREELMQLVNFLCKYTIYKFFITVEVAHAHHSMVKETFDVLNALLQDNLKYRERVMLGAGNIATYEAALFLVEQCKVDVVKCGIASGSHCQTAIMTGCGLPMISSIMDVAKVRETFPDTIIIADGGFSTPGDIAKAIVAGADAVMLGRMLAGCVETPGLGFYDSKTSKNYKLYRGSASLSYKLSQGTSIRNVEGVSSIIERKGTIKQVLDNIGDGLKSAMSYAGVETIVDLRDKGVLRKVSNSGHFKGLPHGIL